MTTAIGNDNNANSHTDAPEPLLEVEGLSVADAAGVGTLAIFHHDPSHDDAFMDGVAREAAAARPGTAANGRANKAAGAAAAIAMWAWGMQHPVHP